jgi:hypothetical protein
VSATVQSSRGRRHSGQLDNTIQVVDPIHAGSLTPGCQVAPTRSRLKPRVTANRATGAYRGRRLRFCAHVVRGVQSSRAPRGLVVRMDSVDPVEDELRRAFPEPLRAAARGSLPAQEDLPLNPPYQRVLIAVIKLSAGSLNKLAYYSEQARRDWRDVLYWTEAPQDASAARTYEELRRQLKLPPE